MPVHLHRPLPRCPGWSTYTAPWRVNITPGCCSCILVAAGARSGSASVVYTSRRDGWTRLTNSGMRQKRLKSTASRWVWRCGSIHGAPTTHIRCMRGLHGGGGRLGRQTGVLVLALVYQSSWIILHYTYIYNSLRQNKVCIVVGKYCEFGPVPKALAT